MQIGHVGSTESSTRPSAKRSGYLYRSQFDGGGCENGSNGKQWLGGDDHARYGVSTDTRLSSSIVSLQVASPWYAEMQPPIAQRRSTLSLYLRPRSKIFSQLEKVCTTPVPTLCWLTLTVCTSIKAWSNAGSLLRSVHYHVFLPPQRKPKNCTHFIWITVKMITTLQRPLNLRKSECGWGTRTWRERCWCSPRNASELPRKQVFHFDLIATVSIRKSLEVHFNYLG